MTNQFSPDDVATRRNATAAQHAKKTQQLTDMFNSQTQGESQIMDSINHANQQRKRAGDYRPVTFRTDQIDNPNN